MIDDADFPLVLFTYKEIYGGQLRTPGNHWLQYSISPDNRGHITLVTPATGCVWQQMADYVRAC